MMLVRWRDLRRCGDWALYLEGGFQGLDVFDISFDYVDAFLS